jgi:hypothetical protein
MNKEKIADWFYKIAMRLDPRLPKGEVLMANDIVLYGNMIVKRVDPRKFHLEKNLNN